MALVAAAGLVATALTVGPPPATAAPSGPRGTKADTGKLSSRLSALSLAATGRTAPEGTAFTRQPDNRTGGMKRLGNGRVVVDVTVDATDGATQARLVAAGADVLSVSEPQFRTVTVAVPDAGIERLATVDGVRSAMEVVTPVRRAVCTPVASEGDVQLKADQARSAFDVDGTGVTVGILSDSYSRNPPGAATTAAVDVAAGDLPGPANPCGRLDAVSNLDDSSDPPVFDEGRAMAQTVHDLAPGARISFATAFVSETSFANNITALASAGAKVIVDDVGYFAEPMYQDGPVAVAVNNAKAAGVSFFSAAGNSNIRIGGVDVGSYEAPAYRGTPCPALPPDTYLDCHNFSAGGADNTSGMVLPNGRTLTLDLQWAQPRGGVTSDFDLCILDAGTGAKLDCGLDFNVDATQQAFEYASYTNNTGSAKAVTVVVARYSGPQARFKWVHLGDDPSSVEYSTSGPGDVFGPTIFGHSGTSGAFSTGAVHYSNDALLEPYSSKGPITNLFAPVPSTTPLGSPQVLSKPDFVASDCVQNSFFFPGSASPHRFCGTSNAAPHAAAVAALMIDANPALTPDQVGAALKATARPVGAFTAPAVGAGLLDARAALQIVAPAAARYNPVPPARILDTRTGTGAPTAKIGPAGRIDVQVTGNGGVPATGVSAVVMNVTVVNPTAPGSVLTVWPTGQPQPLASNLNYVAGQVVPNLVIVKVGTAGMVSLFNHAGSTDVIGDVAGWYGTEAAIAGSRYTAVTPARTLDTRTGTGAPLAKVGPAGKIDVQVTGAGGIPSDGVSAVVLNVTVANPTASSVLTVWPAGETQPLASNLNYVAGQVVANLVVVKLGADGKVSLFNHAGATDVLADVAGYFGADGAATGARYTAITPARVLDTRVGTGALAGKVGPGGTVELEVFGNGGIPATGVTAVVLNVTVVEPTAAGSVLTVWPTGQPQPLASSLNYAAGQVVPNLVVVKVGAGGKVSFFNHAGSTHVLADVAGWYNAE